METSSPSSDNIVVTKRGRNGKDGVNYSLNAYLGAVAVGPSTPSSISFSRFSHPVIIPLPPFRSIAWHPSWFLISCGRSVIARLRAKERRESRRIVLITWKDRDIRDRRGRGDEAGRKGLYSRKYFTESLERVSRPEPRNLSSPLCTNAPFLPRKWIRPGFIG